MHRLSIGSPAPAPAVDASKDRYFSSDDDGGRGKSEKPHRPWPPPEKTIHLIPFVVLFCFLVLFLVSHEPSNSDSLDVGAAGAASATRLSFVQGSTAGRVMKAEMEAVRGHRSLQDRRRFRPRRLGHFKV